MLCSLWGNDIGDKGATALAAILKETQISTLMCAATSRVFAFVSAPADTHTCPLTLPPPIPRSIGYNRIGDEGASALAAILKETMISNLKCAAARWCSPFCQRPLTLLTTSHTPLLAVCEGTASVPREQPLSRGASRATQHCKCSSKPPPTRTSLSVRLSVSAAPALSLCPHPSLAVSGTTASDSRVPSRSPTA